MCVWGAVGDESRLGGSYRIQRAKFSLGDNLLDRGVARGGLHDRATRILCDERIYQPDLH